MTKFNKISVIGLGYIGLPTAVALASSGISVIGVDIDEQVVDTINNGRSHFVERGLNEKVKEVVKSGHLVATNQPRKADAFLIAVPTPFIDDHIPDLRFVETAAKTIAPFLEKKNLILLESTCPIGTTEHLTNLLQKERPDLSFPSEARAGQDVNVAYCPERVLPGKIMEELVNNDRIIGGMTEECSQRSVDLYSAFVKGRFFCTDPRTAELAKLSENSFRDVNIAFANELSMICDKLSVNVWDLIELSNKHPRVNILQPGPGVGGHCIAVDPWFIVNSAPDESKLIRCARKVNDRKPEWVLGKITEAIRDYLAANSEKQASDISIACLGLAFKPDIDDLRESPALEITTRLADLHKGDLLVVEPNIETLPGCLSGRARLQGLATAIGKADILVLLVDHAEFKSIERGQYAGKVLVDTRGVWQQTDRCMGLSGEQLKERDH